MLDEWDDCLREWEVCWYLAKDTEETRAWRKTAAMLIKSSLPSEDVCCRNRFHLIPSLAIVLVAIATADALRSSMAAEDFGM